MAEGRGGARPGAGRKKLGDEVALARLIDTSWPLAERKQCINVLSARARAGDIKAATLLMAYAYGKPVERVISDNTHHHEGLPATIETAVIKIYGDGVKPNTDAT